MRLSAECTIDLDEKRRIWNLVVAEDVDPRDASNVAHGLASAASAGALDNYQKVSGAIAAPGEGEPEMPAFGDDDGD